MQDIFTIFSDFIASLLQPYGLSDLGRIIALIPILIVVYIIYLIIMRTVTLTFRRVGMPIEARSSIRLMMRLLFFGFALTLILGATTSISGTVIITGGAIFGTAIGLAFSKALSNIVSGFYVLGARPFRVGDYVKIGDIEGIVQEITLNYTRLLLPDYTREFVPNSKVVDSQVTNYRVRIEDIMTERGKEFQDAPRKSSRFSSAVHELHNLAKGTEVYRYSFELSVNKDYDIASVKAYFDKVCNKWSDEFIERPEVLFWGEVMFGLVYKVIYIVRDPKDILGKGSDFTHEMSKFQFEAMKR